MSEGYGLHSTSVLASNDACKFDRSELALAPRMSLTTSVRVRQGIPGPAGRIDRVSSKLSSSEPTAATTGKGEDDDDPFQAQSWRGLCSAVGIPLQTERKQQSAVLKRVVGCTILEILEGAHDFKASKVAAIIIHVQHTTDGMWTLRLRDPSTTQTIVGCMTPDTAKVHESQGILSAGSSIFLRNCSVLLCPISLSRSLNIDSSSIMSVFSKTSIICTGTSRVNTTSQPAPSTSPRQPPASAPAAACASGAAAGYAYPPSTKSMSPPLSLMQYSSSNLTHSSELYSAASLEQPEKKKRVRTID